MKLRKETEDQVRILIRKAVPALISYKKELEENEGGQLPSSLLYEQVISSLTALRNIGEEIRKIDNERMDVSKNQIKLFDGNWKIFGNVTYFTYICTTLW